MNDSTHQREVVFLLHGIGAHRWMMVPLARRLQAAGYEARNWGYRSVIGCIEDHAERLAEELAQLEHDHPGTSVHIVAHSMGCIVTRVALAKHVPHNLRRVVFLGPPNRGAPLASFFGPWLRGVCRAIDQLAARADSFVNQLAMLEGVEFGVIAAGRDLLVPLESTHLPGEKDHAVVRSMHSELIYRQDVAQMITNFLREGKLQSLAHAQAESATAVTN